MVLMLTAIYRPRKASIAWCAFPHSIPIIGGTRPSRLSKFCPRLRHTSFALVEILPQVKDDTEIDINPNDLRIDTFRAAGAGGQSVQKNDTAVRITHVPTGIVAQCQNERSQTQNREIAMRVLHARLLAVKREQRKEKIEELRGEYQKAEWGSQIRSYVLHPYQMVKDHRRFTFLGSVWLGFCVPVREGDSLLFPPNLPLLTQIILDHLWRLGRAKPRLLAFAGTRLRRWRCG